MSTRPDRPPGCHLTRANHVQPISETIAEGFAMPRDPDRDYLTASDIAHALGCSRRTVYARILTPDSGLPYLELGRRKLVARSAFERWFEQGGRPTVTPRSGSGTSFRVLPGGRVKP